MRLLRCPRCPQTAADFAAYLTIDGVHHRQNCERDREQHERHSIRVRILKRLHVIVDIDRDGARDTSKIAADHEHNAELAHGVGKAENNSRYDTRNRERTNHSPKCFEAASAKYGGSIQEFAIDGFEGCDERLNGKRQTIEHGRENQSFECEGQAVAKKCLPNFSQRAMRPHRYKHVKSKNRRRQHQRQCYDRLEQKLAAPIRIRQPIRERQSTREENCGNAERESEREQERVHSYLFCGLAGAVTAVAGENVKPYFASVARPDSLFTKSKKARAASLFVAFLKTTAACSMGGCISAGISQSLPSFIPGETASDIATMPACAFPDCTNWAACEIFSP